VTTAAQGGQAAVGQAEMDASDEASTAIMVGSVTPFDVLRVRLWALHGRSQCMLLGHLCKAAWLLVQAVELQHAIRLHETALLMEAPIKTFGSFKAGGSLAAPGLSSGNPQAEMLLVTCCADPAQLPHAR
jgi:hypothetical protein